MATIEKLPFEFGSGEGTDFRLAGEGVAERHCAVQHVRRRGLCLVRKAPGAALVLNGKEAEVEELAEETDWAVRVGSHLLAMRGSRDAEGWKAGLNAEAWTLESAEGELLKGPAPVMELCEWALQAGGIEGAMAKLGGVHAGFPLNDLLECVGLAAGAAWESGSGEGEASVVPVDAGDFTCPVCWLRFDAGDVMHVATHSALRGDPVLGEDAPQRFHATQFNNLGQALDAFGLPCPDMACPHCRRVLPSGLLEMPHYIISIVGDQGAGKSYYLSVLAKRLPILLWEQFGIRFQDADPSGNAMLNEMKRALFSARSPEETRLAKTQLEGAMYERLPRFGRMAALPKPFVFHLLPQDRLEHRCGLIFYDNAGEHFQPGRDSADSPGAQHVASSAGIIFLFDPFNNPEFRRRMEGKSDPQLARPILDQQDVILTEMQVRLRKILNLAAGQRIAKPLAVVIGKSDAWEDIAGPGAFVDPVEGGRIGSERIEENSNVLRRLMLDLCPTVVANAEGISSTVRFFPVSSFGHSPVQLQGGECVPDPRRLAPKGAEVPVLWLLSQIQPDLISTGPPRN